MSVLEIAGIVAGALAALAILLCVLLTIGAQIGAAKMQHTDEDRDREQAARLAVIAARIVAERAGRIGGTDE